MKYQYNFYVEQDKAQANTSVLNKNNAVDFVIECHDDVFSIIEELGNDGIVDDTTCAAFVFGLKSLGFAMINNKDSVLIEKLMPHFATLMREMKKEIAHIRST